MLIRAWWESRLVTFERKTVKILLLRGNSFFFLLENGCTFSFYELPHVYQSLIHALFLGKNLRGTRCDFSCASNCSSSLEIATSYLAELFSFFLGLYWVLTSMSLDLLWIYQVFWLISQINNLVERFDEYTPKSLSNGSSFHRTRWSDTRFEVWLKTRFKDLNQDSALFLS